MKNQIFTRHFLGVMYRWIGSVETKIRLRDSNILNVCNINERLVALFLMFNVFSVVLHLLPICMLPFAFACIIRFGFIDLLLQLIQFNLEAVNLIPLVHIIGRELDAVAIQTQDR